MADPGFEICDLKRHTDTNGRAFWSAIVVAADGSGCLGVDNSWGSWTRYALARGEDPIEGVPGQPGARAELWPPLAAALQKAAKKAAGDVAPDAAAEQPAEADPAAERAALVAQASAERAEEMEALAA